MNETPLEQPKPRPLTTGERLKAMEQATETSEVMTQYLAAVEEHPREAASFQREVAKSLNKLGDTESAIKFALLAANTENTSDQKEVISHLESVVNRMRPSMNVIEEAAFKIEKSSKNTLEAADRNDYTSRRNARG